MGDQEYNGDWNSPQALKERAFFRDTVNANTAFTAGHPELIRFALLLVLVGGLIYVVRR